MGAFVKRVPDVIFFAGDGSSAAAYRCPGLTENALASSAAFKMRDSFLIGSSVFVFCRTSKMSHDHGRRDSCKEMWIGPTWAFDQ